MSSAPLAFVLWIWRSKRQTRVSVHNSLEDAEQALRDFAAGIFTGLTDDDLLDVLEADGAEVHLYGCEPRGSFEIRQFARQAA